MWLAGRMGRIDGTGRGDGGSGGVRVAAVGDLHLRETLRGRFRPALLELGERADVLLLGS